jgi:hypothetical protein
MKQKKYWFQSDFSCKKKCYFSLRFLRVKKCHFHYDMQKNKDEFLCIFFPFELVKIQIKWDPESQIHFPDVSFRFLLYNTAALLKLFHIFNNYHGRAVAFCSSCAKNPKGETFYFLILKQNC